MSTKRKEIESDKKDIEEGKKRKVTQKEKNAEGLIIRETLEEFKERYTFDIFHLEGFSKLPRRIIGRKVGEYLDLIPLVDLISSLGGSVVQLLPLNATGPDNSPFSPISSFSLNPLLVSLTQLPLFDQQTQQMEGIVKDLFQLNEEVHVNWTKVKSLKEEWLRLYYAFAIKDSELKSDFQTFQKEHKYWLSHYSLFCVLKNKNEGKAWDDWEEILPEGKEGEALLAHWAEQHKEEMEWFEFVQFLAFKQMKKVKEYSLGKGVFLKGDIPFLVSRDSADVWVHKKFFNLNYSAGAPPDLYSATGQEWGVPLYRWDELEKSNYEWWKMRLSVGAIYMSLYRLDHLVGFFRVWAVPIGKMPTEGSYEPKEEEKWIPQGTLSCTPLPQGEKFLGKLLEWSELLPIGEDLGTVSPEIRQCMQRNVFNL